MEIPVSGSSLLAQASYDEERGELTVVFRSNGAKWCYGTPQRPVPLQEVESMAGDGSAGAYFLANIRDQYPARRV